MTAPTDDADLRDVVARLQVARWTGRLPRDLADSVLDLLAAIESATERRRTRDHWLRVAGRFWSGSAWVRARFVHAELVLQARRPIVETLAPETFRGAVRAALLIDSRVPSRKTIARALELDTAR